MVQTFWNPCIQRAASAGSSQQAAWNGALNFREEVVQVWDDMKTLASPPSCQDYFTVFKFGNPNLNLPLATVNWVGG